MLWGGSPHSPPPYWPAQRDMAWFVFIYYRDPKTKKMKKRMNFANPVVDIAASGRIGVLFSYSLVGKLRLGCSLQSGAPQIWVISQIWGNGKFLINFL